MSSHAAHRSGSAAAVPAWLDLPPTEVPPPVTATAPPLLPFAQLTPENFERLVLQLARRSGEVEHAQLYGTRGQDQQGIDVYCRLAAPAQVDRRYLTIQCRNVADLSPGRILIATEDFLNGTWAPRSETFVFATRASVVRTGLAEAVETAAARLQAGGIRFEVWDAEHLSERLRRELDLVRIFFGRATAELFCGAMTSSSATHDSTDRANPADLPTVDSVTDIALLRVHPAIPLIGPAWPNLHRDLPSYIPRDIDIPVRETLSSMAATGGFLLLVGRAASGKTRLAYEAVKEVMASWRLCLPGSVDDLSSLARGDLGSGQIVVWLDDLERFLELGQLSSGLVQRLISDAGRPVVLVGSIWPEQYDRLREHGGPDEARTHLRREAREVLRLAHRFEVTSEFSHAETLRAREIARVDPRIREAVGHSDIGSPTAVLACAPELIYRHRQASDPSGAAVLNAAVDIRLCGHVRIIPASLLERVAGSYLPPAVRATADPDWFASGARWATAPVRGTISPLVPHATTIGSVDGYEASDILVADAINSPDFSPRNIPAGTWDHLASEADPISCEPVGFNAVTIGRVDAGRRALRRAADAGSTVAPGVLGFSYFDEGNLADAMRWFQQLHDLGHEDAAGMIAVIHREMGDTTQARLWLERAANAGDLGAMLGYGSILEDDGDLNGASLWYQRGIDQGFVPAMTYMAGLQRRIGNPEASALWMERAAAAGEPNAMMNLALDQYNNKDLAGAERWLRAAAAEGEVQAIAHLAQVLRETERFDEAARWAMQAAKAGHSPTYVVLGMLLAELGDTEQSEQWLRRGADAGDPDAMLALGSVLEERGDVQSARKLFALAATEHATPRAILRYAVFLNEFGSAEDARTWFQRAVQTGDPEVLALLNQAGIDIDQEAGTGASGPTESTGQPSTRRPYRLGLSTAPTEINWTPIEHKCKCVIEWGWSSETSDPAYFIQSCLNMPAYNCPWHGAASGLPVDSPMDAVLDMKDPGSGRSLYARRARGDTIQIGKGLTAEIVELASLIASGDTERILASAPTDLIDWYKTHGYDPVDEWINSRLTDIVLNRGHTVDWQTLFRPRDER